MFVGCFGRNVTYFAEAMTRGLETGGQTLHGAQRDMFTKVDCLLIGDMAGCAQGGVVDHQQYGNTTNIRTYMRCKYG